MRPFRLYFQPNVPSRFALQRALYEVSPSFRTRTSRLCRARTNSIGIIVIIIIIIIKY